VLAVIIQQLLEKRDLTKYERKLPLKKMNLRRKVMMDDGEILLPVRSNEARPALFGLISLISTIGISMFCCF
jgi:hypothetical protein